MNLFGKAAETADVILRAFENPASLPAPLATLFIHRKDDCPCRLWSWRNQLIAALHGHSDARGYRQWEQAGRKVKHGEKAFYILSPCVKPITDKDTGEKKNLLYGFKGTPVFGYDQTKGDSLPVTDPALRGWLQALPLREVAEEWGLSVEVYKAKARHMLGAFRASGAAGRPSISLGVKNLSTWAHELVHAADHRNGRLKELGQHWRSETVAELGGAVLLTAWGLNHDADLGGCWQYIKSYARKECIEVLQACNRVLERTCMAVALILDTAEAIRAEAGREVA